MILKPGKVFSIALTAARRFYVERYTYRVSALAFTTLLALVPVLFVMVFFISSFPFFIDKVTLGKKYIVHNFVPGSSLIIQKYLENFLLQAVRLPAISIIFLFATAIMLVDSIQATLNEIWGSAKSRWRLFPTLLLWFILFLFPVFIGWSIYLSTSFFSLPWFSGATKYTSLILGGLPIAINTMIFGVIYVIVPNVAVRWRDGMLGGLVAALLFEIASSAFALYVAEFPSYALIYGALAVIPIFLVWLYIFWFILLYGAVYASEYAMSVKKTSPAAINRGSKSR
jgi:membrane protein